MALPAVPAAQLTGRVLDSDTGELIPCTVSIRTADGRILTEHPGFREGFRSSGIFEKEVPPGPATVIVSRGFDYVAVEQRVELRDGERRHLEFHLRRRSPLTREGWLAGDSHVHMIHGERRIVVDFADVALAARAEGLDYLSLAQRWNLPDPTPEALDEACARVSTTDFLLTWNLEAPKNYWRGDVSHCAGHGWTFGMRGRTADGRNAIREPLDLSAWDYESHKPPVPNFEIHALIHSLGGLVAYTHPHRWWFGKWGGQGGFPVEERKFVSNMAAELPFDTLAGPTYDALDILMQPREREVNRKAQELWFLLLNKSYRIPATASSDTTFDNPGSAVPGKVRVYTRVAGPRTPPASAAAVKAGRNFVTSGPLLLLEIDGRRIGDVVPLHGERKMTVRLRAWASGAFGEYLSRVELIRNGEVRFSFEPPERAAEFTQTFEITESGTAWYAARCFGSTQDQVAITNPIYFEGPDYRAPQPQPARVAATVRDARTGFPLDGRVEVLRLVGAEPVIESEVPFRGGRFELSVPATARLRVRAEGHAPVTRSVFADYPPLLNLMLNLRDAQLSDWATFEQTRVLLNNVHLDFALPAVP